MWEQEDAGEHEEEEGIKEKIFVLYTNKSQIQRANFDESNDVAHLQIFVGCWFRPQTTLCLVSRFRLNGCHFNE